jgi:hypothetical protein
LRTAIFPPLLKPSAPLFANPFACSATCSALLGGRNSGTERIGKEAPLKCPVHFLALIAGLRSVSLKSHRNDAP